MFISVIIPCYKSGNALIKVIEEIESTIAERDIKDYEIILVSDCPPDQGKTMDLIKGLCDSNKNVKGIDLAKNFGQASALMAGFAEAKGQYVITAEDDGQSSVSELWNLYDKLQEGYDIVCARNITNPPRSLFRKLGAKLNRFMLDFMLEKPADVSPSIFFLAKRQVIQEMLRYDKPYPYIGGLILRSTSRIGNIDINRRDRESGQSGYTVRKLVGLFVNGLTAFSIKPLRLATFWGIFSFIIGIMIAIAMCIRKFVFGGILPGYTSIIVLLLILGGLILLVLGIIGEYIGRIYMCINNEPQYVIRDKYNCEDLE